MTTYKDDMNEAKSRLNAWWDHELIDRPCISYWDFRGGEKLIEFEKVVEVLDPWYLAQNWDDFDTCLEIFENALKHLYFGGENIPRFFPNYGPGIMGAVFGIEPKFMSGTIWFEKNVSLKEIVPLLEETQINMNNPWYARLKKITKIAAIRGKGKFSVALTDLGGVLDILSSFLGPENIIFSMKDDPGLIDTCRAIILEKLMKVYDDLQTIVEHYGDGCNSWLNIWCPKRYYPIQSDFSAMLSPKWFKRFVLPDLITQAEHMDYALYHLDGPNQLNFLDEILSIPSIHGIQWVPGMVEEPKCSNKWMPIYKKIQAAEKSVIIDLFEKPELLPHFYSQLDTRRLFIIIIFFDNVKSAFYLPKFIEGQGGLGNFKTFRREYRKEMKEKLNKTI